MFIVKSIYFPDISFVIKTIRLFILARMVSFVIPILQYNSLCEATLNKTQPFRTYFDIIDITFSQ